MMLHQWPQGKQSVDCKCSSDGVQTGKGNRGPKPWELPGACQDPAFINYRIEKARNPLSVLQIVDSVSHCLTEKNLVDAFRKIAMLRGNRADIVHATTFQQMVWTAVHNVKMFTPEDLANVVWSLALLQTDGENRPVDVEQLDCFAVQLAENLDIFPPKGVSTVLWGFAKLAYIPGKGVLHQVMDYLHKSLHAFDSVQLSEVIWSLACMQSIDREVLLAATPRIFKNLHQLLPTDIAQLLWAYVILNEHPGDEFLSSATKQVFAHQDKWCGAEAGILLLWDLANFGFFPGQEVLDVLKNGFDPENCMKLHGIDRLVRVLYAYAKFCYHPGQSYLGKLAHSLAQCSRDLEDSAVEIILWAYATFSYHPGQKLLQECAKHIEKNVGKYNPVQLANVLWCYQLFDLCSVDVWCTLVNHIHLFPPHTIPSEALLRLYEVYLVKQNTTENLHGQGFVVLSPELEEQCKAAWSRQMEQRQDQMKRSHFHQMVAGVLKVLNVDVIEHAVTEDQLFVHDFALPSAKILLDMIGPESFMCNSTSAIGSVLFHIRLLQAYYKKRRQVLGWKPVPIPYSEWHQLKTDVDKQRYLKEVLMEHAH